MATPYGLTVAGLDYSGVAEDEFDDWYDLEHIPERLVIKGVLGAERWIGVENPKLSIVTYDFESPEVSQSPAYRAISGEHMTVWSKRVVAKCKRVCGFDAVQLLPGQQAAPAGAGGALLVGLNVPEEADAEFNAWCNEEHIPRLATVKGCLAARRFKTTRGTQRYLNLYHYTSPEIPTSAEWKKAGASPWRDKMVPYFRDHLRYILRPYVRAQ